MDTIKEKSASRSSSKVNLNESTLPLLEDQELENKGETPEKERIEMESKSEEKEDHSTEKEDKDEEEKETDGEDDKKKDKKKKEKKKKEKKPVTKTHRRTVSCTDNLTIGLNLLDRDDRHVNDHVNLVFEDVLAEPDATHGFDSTWRLTYLVFSGTKYWVYRILAALLALPCGLTWGIVFSLLTLLNVWMLTPLLRTLDLGLGVLRRVWSGVVRTLLDPFFQAAGTCLGSIRISHEYVGTPDSSKEP